ncbi:hypothetical protein EST62_01965 [Chlorobaculum sp. 24CR]|uniref:hypothetical protein n=1 Tax=Chlorobaculum sp. 24CR TaxID=2508878 RepID=UPI00100BC5E0|nr:hypothetical protein [Chlorobaculum sp. 24CR]RXK88652.1 hypothetical protein EST62_01965 [Chlorobaculum sp. 24CR]
MPRIVRGTVSVIAPVIITLATINRKEIPEKRLSFCLDLSGQNDKQETSCCLQVLIFLIAEA